MSKKKLKHITLGMEEDLLEVIKKKAAEAKVTLDSYVEQLLRNDTQEEPNAQTKRALAEAMDNE